LTSRCAPVESSTTDPVDIHDAGKGLQHRIAGEKGGFLLNGGWQGEGVCVRDWIACLDSCSLQDFAGGGNQGSNRQRRQAFQKCLGCTLPESLPVGLSPLESELAGQKACPTSVRDAFFLQAQGRGRFALH
jgi:hypothetical protein